MAASYYVDASIVAGLPLGDVTFDSVATVIGSDSHLTYSDFGYGKAVAAIAARTRARRGRDDQAAYDIEVLGTLLYPWLRAGWSAADLSRAIAFVVRPSLALKFPHAIHIAIAERLELPLLTGDRQQFTAAQKIGIRAAYVSSQG